jgi:predicted amidohydrolase
VFKRNHIGKVMKFNVACIQLNSQDDMPHNIKKAKDLIVAAKNAGADLVVTPENTAAMLDAHSFLKNSQFIAEEHPALQQFCEIAKSAKMWLVIGSLVVLPSRNQEKLVNRSFLINSNGEVASYYDKIHLFDARLKTGEVYQESRRFAAGNKLVLAETPWGKLGMSICYDLRFPYLYRQMALKGASFITVPSAFTETTGKAHWYVLLRSRAIENGCYIFAPNQTGSHPGNRQTYGHSLIINPWGEIIAEAEEKEGYIIAEVDTDLITEVRNSLPSLMHDQGIKFT